VPDTKLPSPPRHADVNRRPGPPPKHVDPSAPFVGALARLYWMLLGNGILVFAALGIAQQGHGHAWAAEAVFWTAVASIILVRYLDIALLGGTTASGQPASLRDWRRYAVCLLAIALAVWVVAHAVAWMAF
jgi:hypothetical protein